MIKSQKKLMIIYLFNKVYTELKSLDIFICERNGILFGKKKKAVLLKNDTHCKISTWINNLNARNAGAKNEQKADSTIKTTIFVQRV